MIYGPGMIVPSKRILMHQRIRKSTSRQTPFGDGPRLSDCLHYPTVLDDDHYYQHSELGYTFRFSEAS